MLPAVPCVPCCECEVLLTALYLCKSRKMHNEKTHINAVSLGALDGDDMDDAAAFVGTQAHAIDPIVERRVRRKIDLFFMPTFILGYGLVYYDKV